MVGSLASDSGMRYAVAEKKQSSSTLVFVA